jgi:hypothetical protein
MRGRARRPNPSLQRTRYVGLYWRGNSPTPGLRELLRGRGRIGLIHLL